MFCSKLFSWRSVMEKCLLLQFGFILYYHFTFRSFTFNKIAVSNVHRCCDIMNIELNRTYFQLHYFQSCFDQNALRAYFSLHSCDSSWQNKVHFYSHTLSSFLVFCACYTVHSTPITKLPNTWTTPFSYANKKLGIVVHSYMKDVLLNRR